MFHVNGKSLSKITFSLCFLGLGQHLAVLMVGDSPVLHLAICPTVDHHLAP